MKTKDGLTLCACVSLGFAAVAGTAQDASTGVSDAEGRLIPGRTFAERDLFADTWDAIDELGRTLGTSETVGAPRAKKVGIFYWTWHEGGMIAQEPYNNERILKEHPEAAADGADPAWGPMGPHHHWGEPLFGYYTTTDPWVSRRHALMLAEAGIDAVVFDSTNGSFTWMDSAWTLMRTWSELRRQGVRTPQFAYMLPFGEQPCMLTSILQLYRDVYRPGKFSDLWFRWRGKPLIHAHPALVRRAANDAARPEAERRDFAEMLDFFTFRPLDPRYAATGPTPGNDDMWCWLEVYPQHAWGPKPDGTFEMCAAGVAQNHTWNGRGGRQGLAAMNDVNVFGRAYMGPKEGELRPGEKLRFAPSRNPRGNEPGRFVWGDNFEQQMARAREVDPDYLFITGWNEWIAGHAGEWMGVKGAFPDQYAPAFSRDLEPSAGVMRDHGYCHLVQGVRRFRGVRAQRAADERPVYRDAAGDTAARDFRGYGSHRYADRSGRNDIVECAVSHDASNVTFRATCADAVTPPTDARWMRLFLSVSFDGKEPHWNHFQYAVNVTSPTSPTQATLARCTGGWGWEPVGTVGLRIAGKSVEAVVPRRLIGQDGRRIDLRFKWADNTPDTGDILDFYRSGDTAPDGRFTYRYFERKQEGK